jgi:hypothetical protein
MKRPKSEDTLLQYPVSAPGGPMLNTSPFRLIFTEPELLIDDRTGEKYWYSSFKGLVRLLQLDKDKLTVSDIRLIG